MTGLTLNYGDAWGLNSYSNPSSSVCKYIHNNIEDGIAVGMRQGLTRTESEDVVAVCLNGDDSLQRNYRSSKEITDLKLRFLNHSKKILVKNHSSISLLTLHYFLKKILKCVKRLELLQNR